MNICTKMRDYQLRDLCTVVFITAAHSVLAVEKRKSFVAVEVSCLVDIKVVVMDT